MISDFSAYVFGLTLIAVAFYVLWSITNKKHKQLLHRLYLLLVLGYSQWAVIMLIMRITPMDNMAMLQFLDSSTYIGGGAIPPLYLLISYCFTRVFQQFQIHGHAHALEQF